MSVLTFGILGSGFGERDYYFKNWVGSPTSFVKLENLTQHLGGAQIWAKVVSEANGGAHKIYNATVHCLIAKRDGKKFIVGDTGAGYAGKMLSMAAKKFGLKCKIFMGVKDIKRQKPNLSCWSINGIFFLIFIFNLTNVF